MFELSSTMLVVILLGAPGTGKGTHASLLSKELKIPHVSTGDLFRQHIREESVLGIQAKRYIDQGNLVPDELVLDMLFHRVSIGDCKNGFILDGFPRTILQAKALDARISSENQVIALNFSLPDATIIERITGRIACKDCSRSYHKSFDPPKISLICNDCGGVLYQRDDDREEIVRKRLEVYRIQTEPLIKHYALQKNALKEIDSQKSKLEVFQDVCKALSIQQLVH